jgi:hypothetical protein
MVPVAIMQPELTRMRTTPMTDVIRTSQVWRDKRRQDRSYQQLELSHLSYVIQWRYDKAREIAGQIESLYVDGAADDLRRTA